MYEIRNRIANFVPYKFRHPLDYLRAIREIPCKCARCLQQRKFIPEVPPCDRCPTHWAVDAIEVLVGYLEWDYLDVDMVCFDCRAKVRRA